MQTISVIVPAYDASSTIGKCIESLITQSRRPDEIIVVDDCSRDNTAEIALNMGADKVVRLTKNLGPGGGRNAGVETASGEILAFTDADCVAPPNWLEIMVAALDAPDVVAATGGYSETVEDSFITRLQYLVLRCRQSKLPAEIESTITSNFVCMKSAFQAVGGFPIYSRRSEPDKPVWGNEDEEIGLLLSRAGGKIRWVSNVGVLHLFRTDLKGYLKQQKFYAERIVMSHFRFADMAKSESNYSRLSGALHLGAVMGIVFGMVALLGWFAGIGWMKWTAAFALVVSAPVYLLLPIPSLLAFNRMGQSARFLIMSYIVLLMVDIAWFVGAVSGTLLSLGGFKNGDPPCLNTRETLTSK